MYDEFETKTSLNYLDKVFSITAEPACLIGGWAVYFTVNERFRERFGRNYLGSRDIDMGFCIDKKWSERQLGESAFAKTLNALESKLDFKLQGFRLRKDFHLLHEKELAAEEAKTVASSFLFTLFVDLAVNETHPKFRKAFGFAPLPEPLIGTIFKSEKHRITLKKGKGIWLPAAEVLLATKLNSVNHRNKEDKRAKDIMDITALLLFATPETKELLKNLWQFYSRKKAITAIKKISEKEKESASKILGIEKNLADAAFEEFLK